MSEGYGEREAFYGGINDVESTAREIIDRVAGQYQENARRETSTPGPDESDQNWMRVDDYESIFNALEESETFNREEGRIEFAGVTPWDPEYGEVEDVKTASYSADGMRIDIMSDRKGDSSKFVRATIVDREKEGFDAAAEEYVDVIAEAEDVTPDYVEEVSMDIGDPFYSVGPQVATDGGNKMGGRWDQ